ncbi:MAG: TfoX/Sxy family protein [Bacteroidales bacterium]
MASLSDLPNIGKTLEEKLVKAGITTPQELIDTGSEKALLLIRTIDESACFNMLCALEGAIQGIRWHGLSKERKEELKQFLKLKDIPTSTNS